MTAAYKVRKLDSRFNGSKNFTHMIEYTGSIRDRTFLFMQQRQWCWETFGPSSELEFYPLLPDMDVLTDWAWQTSHGLIRLYFNEKQLAWFKIKWS